MSGADTSGWTSSLDAVGASVARAAAYLHAHGPDTATAVLDEIDPALAHTYQPYWVTAAEIALARHDAATAEHAIIRAIELTNDPATIHHLRTRIRRPGHPRIGVDDDPTK